MGREGKGDWSLFILHKVTLKAGFSVTPGQQALRALLLGPGGAERQGLTSRGRTRCKTWSCSDWRTEKETFSGWSCSPTRTLCEAVLWTQGGQSLREAASDPLPSPCHPPDTRGCTGVPRRLQLAARRCVMGWPIVGSSSPQPSPNKGLGGSGYTCLTEGISGLFLSSRVPREPGSDTARLKAPHAQPWLLARAFLFALRTHLIGGNGVGSGPLPAPNNSLVLTSISAVMWRAAGLEGVRPPSQNEHVTPLPVPRIQHHFQSQVQMLRWLHLQSFYTSIFVLQFPDLSQAPILITSYFSFHTAHALWTLWYSQKYGSVLQAETSCQMHLSFTRTSILTSNNIKENAFNATVLSVST